MMEDATPLGFAVTKGVWCRWKDLTPVVWAQQAKCCCQLPSQSQQIQKPWADFPPFSSVFNPCAPLLPMEGSVASGCAPLLINPLP